MFSLSDDGNTYNCTRSHILWTLLLLSITPFQQYVGGFRNPFIGKPADGIPIQPASRPTGRIVAPLHLANILPTTTGDVKKSMTVSCVLILVQLNKCVVCGSDLQMKHNGDGCLSASILFKYECWMRHLIVLSWAFVQRIALECCICVIYVEWHDKLVVF